MSNITMCLLCFLLLCIPIILLIRQFWLKSVKRSKNVCILVLGDIGRSPRMQYHATSFAKENFQVDVIGYAGSLPLPELRCSDVVKFYYLRPPPEWDKYLSRTVYYGIKTFWQSATLLWVLFTKHRSDYLLLQNPPAIPTIPICWVYCAAVDARFIIDWHNYAHSLMALTLKESHILVKVAKFVEKFFGSKAYANFCVTQAMQQDLLENWSISARVLYDRPSDQFQPLSLQERHDFLLKLAKQHDVFCGNEAGSTKFTEKTIDGNIELSATRPGLLVSSTSWSEDEDFSILLYALQEYENAIEEKTLNLPELLCVITGKGPLKEFYTSIIKLKKWKHVTVITPWLETEDYPKILGTPYLIRTYAGQPFHINFKSNDDNENDLACADLGVCLHTSSSGLDLPMKVIDMFGCTLPVSAYNFKCLSELIRHNENSYVFSNEKELAEQLKSWFKDFPNNEEQHSIDKRFREELRIFQETRWHGNWVLNVSPAFKQ